jgi:shikimate dehydrogenase
LRLVKALLQRKVMSISANTIISIVIGDPIEHSLSPLIHNQAYQALNIADQFAFFAVRVQKDDLGAVLAGIRCMGIRGISCTVPHKVAVIDYLDELDGLAAKIGAVNTIVNQDGKLCGYNTDIQGVLVPLEKLISISGKKIAVLGAGGAARAAVFGLIDQGADICIFNRTASRAETLAVEAGCQWNLLSELKELSDYDVIMNMTSVGMFPNNEESPLEGISFESGQIVLDAVYNPYETKLLKDARRQGARIIAGLEMFVEQAAAQFALYTGCQAPVDVMKNVIKKYFNR